MVQNIQKNILIKRENTVTIPAWMADMAEVKGLILLTLLQKSIKEKLQLT